MKINNLEFLLFFVYTCMLYSYRHLHSIIPGIITHLITSSSTDITFGTFHVSGLINIQNAVQRQGIYVHAETF